MKKVKDRKNKHMPRNAQRITEVDKREHHIHITSKRKWFEVKLTELWLYRDLIALFTKRSFQVTYRQTVLGPMWLFLNPLITSLVYTLVFGRIIRINTAGVPHILFYLYSTTIWNYFSNSLVKNARTFVANAGLFSKVYFPRLTIPVSNALVALIQYGIQMIIILGFLAYYVLIDMVHPNWTAWLMIPGVLLQLGVLGLGFGIVISSLTTKYRDLSFLVTFCTQLWMYATPIVYPLTQLAESPLKKILMINPLTAPIELFRYAVLGEGIVDIQGLILSWVITIVIAVFGVVLFTWVEKTSMDTV